MSRADDDRRRDPDAFLARIKAEEGRTGSGRLKIFFGYAPGVGKTYAMLESARAAAKEGIDVVVGHVEPHVRPETQALVLGLDLIPHRNVPYHGTVLREFDLDAALKRKPQLLIVDELAHTNAPEMTHAKRWQDVEEVLEAGIDVYTSLNVQHLESLNDVVSRITGITVRETVPDAIFDAAYEVSLVDLAPDDLLERLKEGKVYIPQQAARAIEHFFRKGNLFALRELALRRTAERVNTQVRDYRRAHAIGRTWPTRERLMVCVGPSPLSGRLVRAARRLAAELAAPWVAAHVETPASTRLGAEDRARLNRHLRLAEQLGGESVTLSGVDAIEELVTYARRQNVTRIVVGKTREPRWKEWIFGSFVNELTRRSGDIDVSVISGDDDAPMAAVPPLARPIPDRRWLLPYAWGTTLVALCTAIGWWLWPRLAPPNLVMLYLLAVLVSAARFGRGPAILASILGVATFDLAFVYPYGTLAVSDSQYLVTFGVMLATGLVISTLTTRIRDQAVLSRLREQRTAALYSLSRELAAARGPDGVVDALSRQTTAAFDCQAVILLPDADGQPRPQARAGALPLPDHDLGVARWVLERGRPAGLGTDTLPGSEALFLPIGPERAVLGVLGIRPKAAEAGLDPEQFRLLEAFADQAAVALERIRLAGDAERIRVEAATERSRNALLSAVSHDLRTPLASIAGASSTLLDAGEALDVATQRELLQTIGDESESLNRLVGNLLDVTRLEEGALRPSYDWHSLEELLGVVRSRLARPLERHPLSVRLPDDLPLVRCDGILIQQVLVNLLENAAKYSEPGSTITLAAQVAGDSLRVEVFDRGRGFDPGAEAASFGKFQRGAQTGSRPGAGLGLAICKGVIELHGGRIWAENQPGGGAVVGFMIPIGPPPEEPPDDDG